MELSLRGLWTMIHGMGFGALYLMACSGALVGIYRRHSQSSNLQVSDVDVRFLRNYLAIMAAIAWAAVLSGTYFVYPWYRAAAPSGASNLAGYPQRLLMSNPATSGWHSIGMEWKEHVAWLVPIAITMAAAVYAKYGRNLTAHIELRRAVICFVWISLFAAGVAGFFGAMINKNAPVNGGPVIHIVHGE